MKYKIPAIIFAGGKSSRMGQDKALLPFGGYPSLAAYQYDRLSSLFDNVYLSAKEEKFDFEAPVILDHYPDASPLVGLISAFETLKCEALFILSVDAPFVDEYVIKRLLSQRGDADAVIAKSDSGRQPLCGIYTKHIVKIAKENLKNDIHRLGALLNEVDTKWVYFEDDTRFSNLNHPHEYEEALKHLSEQ